MLAQVLAIAVALGSTLLFLTAFIFPKLHRQDDFFWSAVGLFYALVLWVCAGQMVGAVLLGQLASVILLGWLAWEMLRLRQAIIDPTKIPNLNRVSLVGYVKQRFNKPKPAVTPKAKTATSTPATPVPTTPESTSTESPDTPVATTDDSTPEAAIAPAVVNPTETNEVSEKSTPIFEQSVDVTEAVEDLEDALAETETEALDDETSVSGIVVAVPESADTPPDANESKKPTEVAKTKKGFSFGRLFGRKTKPVAVASDPQTLDKIFEVNEETDADIETEENEASKIESTVEIETPMAESSPFEPEAVVKIDVEPEIVETETSSEMLETDSLDSEESKEAD